MHVRKPPEVFVLLFSDVDSNPDFVACKAEFQQVFLTCIENCAENDYACLSQCNREYDSNMRDCPCQENCPDGCPCPSYSCPETTTQISTTTTTAALNKTVLVVNSYIGWMPAVRVSTKGSLNFLNFSGHPTDSTYRLNW